MGKPPFAYLLLWFLPFSVVAQDFTFKPYGTEDGLSHSLIKDLQEDDKGYLWIGTEYGLNKFDGLHFTTFLPDDALHNSIPRADISKIFKTREGNLIIGFVHGGFSLYANKSQTFVNYPQTPKNDTLKNAQVQTIADDKRFLWIGTTNGLFKIDKINYELIKGVPVDRTSDTSISNSKINALFIDTDENLWIGTDRGLNLLRKNSNVFEKFFNSVQSETAISNDHITAIAQAPDRSIYIGTGYGLNQLVRLPSDRQKKLVFKRTLDFEGDRPATDIRKIIFDSHGNLWVGYERGVARISKNRIRCFLDTEPFLDANGHNYIDQILEDRWGKLYFTSRIAPAGLHVYHPKNDRMQTYSEDSIGQSGLKGDQVASIFIDSNDFLWLGTVKNGMFKCDLNNKPFHTLAEDQKGESPLNGNDTYAITQTDNGTLWVGTNQGLTRIDAHMGKSIHYQKEEKGPLTGNIVGSLLQDSENRLWAGYYDYKTSRLSPDTGRFHHYRYEANDSTAFPLWSVRDIITGDSGAVWFTSTTGLVAEYLPWNDSFKKHVPMGHEVLFNGFGNALVEDKNGTLWIATNKNGLVAYIPQSGKVVQFLHDQDLPTSLSSNMVMSLHLDAKERLWVGTEGGSLDRFNARDSTFVHHDLKLAKSYTTINSIEADDSGILWLGTHDGLLSLDPESGDQKVYTFEDGLADNEFNRSAGYRGTNGTLYFGGPKGVTFFHPDSIVKNPYPPKVLLTGVNIKGKVSDREDDWGQSRVANGNKGNETNTLTILPDTLPESTVVELAYHENDISFDFTVIHHAAPTKNMLKYKLEGFDEVWKTAFSGQQFVEYTNLDSGSYTFLLTAENGDGKASLKQVELQILIHPPFWMTWWFRALLFVVFSAMVYLWYRWRTKSLRYQKLLLKREVSARTHELRVQNELLVDQKLEISKLVVDLKKANESRLHFFTNISHELRTPLTLILGPISTLLKRKSLSPDIRTQLSFVQRNANRLLGLTNELLLIRKLESGVLRLWVKQYPIKIILRNCFTAFEPLAVEQNIRFEFIEDINSEYGWIDADKLGKILNNLLSNAFKYTTEGGSIILRASSLEGTLSISVSDSGIGMSKTDLPKIFDRYYRAENAPSQNPDGAGIGLALTRELVQLHKGIIKVDSVLGKSSDFTVRIPILENAYFEDEKCKVPSGSPVAIKGVDVPSKNENPSKFKDKTGISNTSRPLKPFVKNSWPGKSILLVEDNPDMRNYVQGILNDQFKVTTAVDGREALQSIKKSDFDLVISDVMMPNLNGFELCKILKGKIETSHIPILLLTAKVSGESKFEGLDTGADDYITKPFDADILLLKIRNLFATRRRLRERFRREGLALPQEVELQDKDAEFLKKAVTTVEAHISNDAFNVVLFCEEMAMSKPVLNRKLVALTDLVPSKFIRHVRLKRAAHLIRNGQGTIREIMYDTGFSNSSYFAKVFKETFGVSPTEFAKPTVQ